MGIALTSIGTTIGIVFLLVLPYLPISVYILNFARFTIITSLILAWSLMLFTLGLELFIKITPDEEEPKVKVYYNTQKVNKQ